MITWILASAVFLQQSQNKALQNGFCFQTCFNKDLVFKLYMQVLCAYGERVVVRIILIKVIPGGY